MVLPGTAGIESFAASVSWSDGGPSSVASVNSTIIAILPNCTMSRDRTG